MTHPPTSDDSETFACAFDAEFRALMLRAFGEREADEHIIAIIDWAWARVARAYATGYATGAADAMEVQQ